MAVASQWVARIIAAGALMVLPGLAGDWVDSVLGTSLFALCGFGVGIAGSLCYLVAVTKNPAAASEARRQMNGPVEPDSAEQPELESPDGGSPSERNEDKA
ncbi:MAG: hypothetical protein AAGA92_12905 [Planctomycetota bacterium]